MSNQVIQALTKRRTQYALGKNVSISNAEIESIIKEAVRQTPSSFNSQSSRAVILFGDASKQFWDLTREVLRGLVPAEAFAATDGKMTAFAAGVGTVLFFEDQDTVQALNEKYPYDFNLFSEHSAGMTQLAVWTALAEANVGASLQHYNPVVDEQVRATWNIPASWKLRAQMPFGSNEAAFPEKTFIDDANRFKTFGA
ncbi:nitroreductase family protein [Lampropedia puyangensis]|uniref:Nitroreductase family protein n=1 Tax=Lampropedia puyangensis TaxID=1330072 RepID=A0A4S8FF39_9BURK|nr:nitroreductase family protein [Lampropedia puyangensis]THU05234.1 nitroreductase family protein [Lampropedia puyangensis]